MSIDNALRGELLELAVLYTSGSASPEQFARLEEILDTSEEARAFYIYALDVHAHLYWHHRQSMDEMAMAGPAASSESPVSPIQHADESLPPFAPVFGDAVHGVVGYFSSGWPVAYLVATVILGVGFLIGTFVHVSQPPQIARPSVPLPSPLSPLPSIVGRITGMVDCQWADAATEAFNGAHVPLGRKYALSSGLMEITYDAGAKVILQGPVTFEVESPVGGFLSVGKLTAKLEKKNNSPRPSDGRGAGGEGGQKYGNHDQSQRALTLALSQGERRPGTSSALRLPPSALFAVRTPTAIVTDLGTEFGIEVDKDGSTASHVFRGAVEVRTTSADGTANGDAKVLRENESASVENSDNQGIAKRIKTLAPSAQQASFVREMPMQKVKPAIKIFDLVDVVAGGDGFSGKRNRGIDPLTGRITSLPQANLENYDGDGKYHRVEALPFVDGVFIPDGRADPVQVDSVGHSFASFSSTSNQSAHFVWAGGVPPSDMLFPVQTKLGGIEYASSDHGLLFLHANKGITFDLDAVRRANPDCKLLRFLAEAGNTEPVAVNGGQSLADLWVLVDGQSRFQRRQISGIHGAFSITIPLSKSDHYLTLVATDGGNGISWDWIVFGDPRLELAPAETSDDSTPPKSR